MVIPEGWFLLKIMMSSEDYRSRNDSFDKKLSLIQVSASHQEPHFFPLCAAMRSQLHSEAPQLCSSTGPPRVKFPPPLQREGVTVGGLCPKLCHHPLVLNTDLVINTWFYSMLHRAITSHAGRQHIPALTVLWFCGSVIKQNYSVDFWLFWFWQRLLRHTLRNRNLDIGTDFLSKLTL